MSKHIMHCAPGGEAFTFDSVVADVLVVDPAAGTVSRPTITVVMDPTTRMLVEVNVELPGAALRRSSRRPRIPEGKR